MAVTYETVTQPAVYAATGANAGRTLFLTIDDGGDQMLEVAIG